MRSWRHRTDTQSLLKRRMAGKTYVITASVQQDGKLLVSGPNSCEAVENDAIAMDSEMDAYGSYYANEAAYDRERFACIYSK